MTRYFTIDELDVKNKTVLVRVDFNSPINKATKQIIDYTRIQAHANSTIKDLIERGAKVVLLTHQGRKGAQDFISLKEHTKILRTILGTSVKYVDDLFGEEVKHAIENLKSGATLILKNVRTYDFETREDTPKNQAKTEFVRKLSSLADFYVNDAFSTSHRAHVSIIGFAQVLPSAAGRIMERELKSLSKVLSNPEKPSIFILGGAKAEDSLDISRHVFEKEIADYVLTGGIIGQIFLLATNIDLGLPNHQLLKEMKQISLVPDIKKLIDEYQERIQIPIDFAIEKEKKRKEIRTQELPTSELIKDIGKKTVEKYEKIIEKAKSIVLSGPMGVFEQTQFSYGTQKIFAAVANSNSYSVAGGGHTIAALKKFGFEKKISYISTAGGALIEFLMGKQLPGVVALERQ